MFQKRVTHWIILAFTLVLFLLEGCAEPYSIQIMSLDDGKIITLKREFSHRLCLFTAGNDNNSFWIITANSDNEIFIIKYNMQGGVEKKIKLPFFFDSWLQREERILIPAIDILLYANNNKIFKYNMGTQEKILLKEFPVDQHPDMYYVNDQYFIAKTISGTSSKGNFHTYIHIIDIQTGITLAELSKDSTIDLLGISNIEMKVLLDTSIGPRKYKLASYDIPTGKMIQQIAEKDFYCSDAVWSPDASTIAYDVLGNLYWVKPSSISSTPKLFFAGKNKNIIVTNLQFISENKILFLLHGNHYFSGDRFIVYDINTGQEIQNWPAPNYCNDLRIIGNYAVWEN